jgi:hypothetical protein
MEYVKSAIITFVAGMALVIVPEVDRISLESFQDGALVGLMFAATRTGFKMLLESFLLWYSGNKE